MFGPIAQLDDRPQSWTAFLGKAAKGSHRAAELLVQADMAAAGRALAEEADESQYEETLQRALPRTPPFESPQDLLGLAYSSSALSTYVVASPEPLHDPAHYDDLWKRGTEVKPAVLLHDAAHICHERWNGPHYRELVHRVEDAQLNYNSLNAVAGMLYVCALQALRLGG